MSVVVSEDWIAVGKIGKPHGVRGAVLLHSFTHPTDNILNYQPWYIKTAAEYRLLQVKTCEMRDKYFLLTLEAVHDRDGAALYTNCDVYVPKSVLPNLDADSYYWHELEGMTVSNQSGITLGQVSELIATGSNDVLVIQGGEKKHLVPFIMGRYVMSVDRNTRHIIVDWDSDF